MIKKFFTTFLLCSFISSIAQEKPYTITEVQINPLIKGDLYTPVPQNGKPTLIILIAGSGPTNRNGNQIGMQNNSLKYLAEDLSKEKYAVFSYDKRVIAQIIAGNVNEKEMLFDDTITDAKSVLDYFRKTANYRKIVFAGHSEGSLVGMVAAREANADAFISIAGPGSPIDEILTEQISRIAPIAKEELVTSLEKLKKGESFTVKSPFLNSLLRESIQPYMRSWLKYNPQLEIQKLKIPVLLLNGTKDLQVTTNEAEKLKKAKPDATLVIIDNMNHVLKIITGDDTENKASYAEPDLKNAPELAKSINLFLKKNKL
ncbi:alpha/beta hydrolase family protein [Flavobacterium cerinum]|uniref:Lysophospholipase n=1 Tax=Flavobacterium cerinum TaxID=2502784 RepID=A0ABY5IZA9_9FLAO|nr:lysophospholipase [Flavobacterium cerinum]UUC47073.1 lysophospholipase [Flavobacterium cerinum]